MTSRPGRSQELGLSVILILQVGTMFVLAPLAASDVLPANSIEVCRMGLAAVAVLLVTRNWVVSSAIVLTLLASFVLSYIFRSGQHPIAVDLEHIAALTTFDLAIAWAVAKVAFGQGKVNVHRIMGVLILYLSIALVFANAYRTCALLLHPSFSGLDKADGHFISESLYFSLATLTTNGYGDIIPLHPLVRSLCNLEAVIGQLFPATLLARLVTLHTTETSSGNGDTSCIDKVD
jgi:hypothetical protein